VARDIRVYEVEAPLSRGGSAVVSLYGRAYNLGEPLLQQTCSAAAHNGVPLLTISPPERVEAEADHQLLCGIWASQTVVAGNMMTFRLHADCVNDQCTGHGFSECAVADLQNFLRRRVLDVWRSLVPSLVTMSGSFEIFNPAHGANMGWHQDGHEPGEYIAHYYLQPGLPSTSRASMAWSEVALPQSTAVASTRGDERTETAPGLDEGGGDDETLYALHFGVDEAQRSRVSRDCFVPFGVGAAAAEQVLVVFEDAAVFHRTPLTAHALPALQAERERPIARIVFHGAAADGSPISLPSPAPSLEDSGVAGGPDPRLDAHLNVSLPAGLRDAVEAYAQHSASRRTVAVSQPGPHNSEPSALMMASLDAYVAGDDEMVQFLKQRGLPQARPGL
jgi:hypothetical protein